MDIVHYVNQDNFHQEAQMYIVKIVLKEHIIQNTVKALALIALLAVILINIDL